MREGGVMQKLYRDSKGRFVSRKTLVEEIKLHLSYLPGFVRLRDLVTARVLGERVRTLRNKHKIYETF